MAREPQRASEPRPLDAKLIPVERALRHRAKVLLATSSQVPQGHPDERCAEIYAHMAGEFIALADELRYW